MPDQEVAGRIIDDAVEKEARHKALTKEMESRADEVMGDNPYEHETVWLKENVVAMHKRLSDLTQRYPEQSMVALVLKEFEGKFGRWLK